MIRRINYGGFYGKIQRRTRTPFDTYMAYLTKNVVKNEVYRPQIISKSVLINEELMSKLSELEKMENNNEAVKALNEEVDNVQKTIKNKKKTSKKKQSL